MILLLRTDFREYRFEIGVNGAWKMGFLESEFDLLSEKGFFQYEIKRSVQGVRFEHWLPLPISEDHFEKV